jgi:integrase
MRANSRDGRVQRTYLARHKTEPGKDLKKALGRFDEITFDEALNKVRKLRAAIRYTKQTGVRPVPTLGQAFETYLKLKDSRLASASVDDYKKRMLYLADVKGDSMAILNQGFWTQRYLDLSVKSGKSTAAGVMAVAKMLYKMLIAHDILQANPLNGLTQMGVFKRAAARQTRIARDSLPAFWMWAHTKAHASARDFMLVGLTTGLRLSVVGGLRWDNVN